MSELPKGWVKTTLGKVVDYGCTEKANIEHIDDNVWVLELEDIEKNSSKLLQRISFLERQPKSAKNSFKKGDVLYGKLRPYLNKIIIAPENGICTSEIIPLKTDESLINNYFLFYWLKGIEFCNYVNTVSYGVNMPRLGTKGGKNAPFTLAPLAEQKRIVEKLGDVLAQVGSIKARLDSIPAILKRFRQSVLAAAVSGELTEEWRGVNDAESVSIDHIENLMFEKGVTHGNFGRKLAKASAVEPEELKVLINHKNDWPLVRIGSICESVVPNRDKPKSFGGGYHWLLTPNFDEQNIHIDYSKIEYGLTLEETKKYKAKIIKSGNVVMTCIGRVGLSAVLQQDSVINQQLHAFIVNEYIKAEYLAYCIRANMKYFELKATSTTINYLNKTSCNSLPIPLPSIEEQTEIVRLVDQYFAFADAIEKQVKNAQQRVDKLTQSVLAKAFRGELVPQDPNDEPADKLLERIAKAKQDAEALAKAAKKSVKKGVKK